METYVLKFSACLLVFWLVYVLFLERQNMHRFKRFYLLGALVLAITIPTLTITEYIEPVVTNFETEQIGLLIDPSFVEIPIEETPVFTLENVLWFLYGFGVLLFSIRFIINLVKMQQRISKNENIEKRSFVYVLLQENLIPHSFFTYIFLNKFRFETNNIPKEVMLHEETHAKQLHSLDIIILELLQIAFWFHPLIYILKHYIKMNHEFLADQAVLNQGSDAKTYQTILLQFSSNTQDYSLSSAINYSSIKKRFTVMKTQTSKTRIWLSTLLILPIIAVLFYSFAERVEIEKQNPIPVITEQQEQPILTILINRQGEFLVDDEIGTMATIETKLKSLSKFANTTKAVYVKYDSSEASKQVLEKVKTMVIEHKFKIIIADASSDTIPPPPPPIAKPDNPKKGGPNANNYEVAKKINKTIKPVEILIKKDNSIILNNKPVSFTDLLNTVSKINEDLTIDQRRNYVTASIQIESNESLEFAQKIQSEIRKADIWSSSITHLENQKKAGLATKHFSPNAGLTIEEAKIEQEKVSKKAQEFKPSKDSPWSIETETATVVQDPEQKQGPIEIDGKTYYYSNLNGKTTYYNRFGTEVTLKNPPQQKSTNPSFLEFVEDMEKQGATFFLDDEKITAKEAKSIAKSNKGKNTEMVTRLDDNGKYIVKFSKPKVKEQQKSILPIVNGNKIPSGIISMNINEIKKLILTLPDGKITSFKLKIPGIKTEVIEGNSITKLTLQNLNSAKTGDVITLFDIKDDKKSKFTPVAIEIID